MLFMTYNDHVQNMRRYHNNYYDTAWHDMLRQASKLKLVHTREQT
jgi:hypothetical protein